MKYLLRSGPKLALAILVIAAMPLLRPSSGASAKDAGADWSHYGGGPGGEHYSPLSQINRNTVRQLKQAWRFDTGPGSLQTSPLMIGGVLYAMGPKQEVMALEATTGRLIWRFDEAGGSGQPVRGLTFWTDGQQKRLYTSHGTDLVALDAETGQLATEFADNGHLDMRTGLPAYSAKLPAFLTSPGVIFDDVIIVGFRTAEARPAARGMIRAFDVRTGKLRWKFDLVADGSTQREPGGYNAWSGMVVDQQRGILFVPTGSAVDDFYGGDRPGDNLYANSLVALDARTGQRRWHFQIVHHDIWDRDLPSAPVLITVTRDGRKVDAVAQTTKHGLIFLFDRENGHSLFPIEERPVPASDIPGERTSPTQPFPLLPTPFARQHLTEDDLTSRTKAARAAAMAAFRQFHKDGPFAPLRLDQRTLVFPGFDGGAEWGGAATDPDAILYVNSNEMAWTGGLAKRLSPAEQSIGERLFQEQCSACHGDDRKGSPPAIPDLSAIATKRSVGDISILIKAGLGRMPGFPHLSDDERTAIGLYLHGEATLPSPDTRQEVVGAPTPNATPYRFTGYQKFLDPDGYPAIAPPWGTLNAIDMNSGRHLWRVPLGQYPELVAQGLADTGSENYGGPLVTAGGLVVIGATLYDSKMRAFDSSDGRLLWETTLPFSGMATPVTYMVDGRQFIVIATTNSRNPKGASGSAYVAFAIQ